MIVSDELIKQEFLKDNGKMRRNNKKYLLYHDYLSKRFNDSNSDEETVYRILFDIEQKPICPVCGGHINFIDYNIGFPKTCSKKCAANRVKESTIKHTKDELSKDFISSFFIDKEGKYIAQRLQTKYLKENGWYDLLMSYYNDTTGPQETLYRILNDLDVRPVCKICGKPVKFDHNRGFSSHCSQKCTNSDPEILSKNAASVSKTLTKLYQEKGNEIKEKRRKTLLENHGIDACTPFASEKFQNKAKETIKARYGVDNVMYLPEYHINARKAAQQHSIELQKSYGYDISYSDDGNFIIVHNGCKIHGDIALSLSLFNNRTRAERRDTTILCPICNKQGSYETGIEVHMKMLLTELGVEFKQHDRTQIKPFELDFYLPKYQIAIECNGLYWHSGEDNRYVHAEKQKICEDKGIQLLYFWEDDILHSLDKIRGFLKSKLGLNQTIYARQCEIKEVSSKDSREFLEKYHLQGNVNASVKYGLYYNNKLVQLMTFGKIRKIFGNTSKEGYYELYRLCGKEGITVIGGPSKLFKHFIENMKPIEVISYCHKDISNGNVYRKIGMQKEVEVGIGYSYWKQGLERRINRFSLRKDKVDDGSGRSAFDILDSQGYRRCYNSGTKKFIWNNQLT